MFKVGLKKFLSTSFIALSKVLVRGQEGVSHWFLYCPRKPYYGILKELLSFSVTYYKQIVFFFLFKTCVFSVRHAYLLKADIK